MPARAVEDHRHNRQVIRTFLVVGRVRDNLTPLEDAARECATDLRASAPDPRAGSAWIWI